MIYSFAAVLLLWFAVVVLAAVPSAECDAATMIILIFAGWVPA
jgi:hypothetical protein